MHHRDLANYKAQFRTDDPEPAEPMFGPIPTEEFEVLVQNLINAAYHNNNDLFDAKQAVLTAYKTACNK